MDIRNIAKIVFRLIVSVSVLLKPSYSHSMPQLPESASTESRFGGFLFSVRSAAHSHPSPELKTLSLPLHPHLESGQRDGVTLWLFHNPRS